MATLRARPVQTMDGEMAGWQNSPGSGYICHHMLKDGRQLRRMLSWTATQLVMMKPKPK